LNHFTVPIVIVFLRVIKKFPPLERNGGVKLQH